MQLHHLALRTRSLLASAASGILATLLSTVVAIPMFAPVTASAGAACVSDMTCNGCHRTGRAYVKVGGLYCTVCMMFCYPPLAGEDSPANDESSPSKVDSPISKRTIKLVVPDELVIDMAATNPDAAHVLFVLDLRGRQEDDVVTAKGQGGSPFLANENFVRESLTAIRAGSETSFPESLPASSVRGVGTDVSRVRWVLENASGEAPRLVLTHRIVSEDGQEVAQLHRDVVVELEDVSRSKDGTISARASRWATR